MQLNVNQNECPWPIAVTIHATAIVVFWNDRPLHFIIRLMYNFMLIQPTIWIQVDTVIQNWIFMSS